MLGLIYKQEKEYECVTDYQTVSNLNYFSSCILQV